MGEELNGGINWRERMGVIFNRVTINGFNMPDLWTGIKWSISELIDGIF